MAAMERAVVIGCGIIGLATAVRLREEGWAVKILAKDLPPETTSDRAAAIWEPFEIEPRDRAGHWAATSYRRYRREADDPATGVQMVELVQIHRGTHLESPFWLRPEYPHRSLEIHELPAGYRSGLAVRVPFVPSSRYLQFLLRCFREGGGQVEQRRLRSLDEALGEEPGADLLVNCSGLGARELAEDPEVRPIRGQLAVVSLEAPVRYLIDDTSDAEPLYMFPRGREVFLGGTTEWDREELGEDAETRHRILERCRAVEPNLRGSRFLRAEVGLRPGRRKVRLEREEMPAGVPLVHNYGHGGAGFTVAWGCADEVISLGR